jgi:hypothetical protein
LNSSRSVFGHQLPGSYAPHSSHSYGLVRLPGADIANAATASRFAVVLLHLHPILHLDDVGLEAEKSALNKLLSGIPPAERAGV